MDVVLGRNVTLRTLLDKPTYTFVVWTYNDGVEQVHVATLSGSGLKVNERYEGRVSVDRNTGSLFLGEAKTEDSGDFGISVISADGTTETAEIKLRVLRECFGSAPGPRLGAPGFRHPQTLSACRRSVCRSVTFLCFFLFLRAFRRVKPSLLYVTLLLHQVYFVLKPQTRFYWDFCRERRRETRDTPFISGIPPPKADVVSGLYRRFTAGFLSSGVCWATRNFCFRATSEEKAAGRFLWARRGFPGRPAGFLRCALWACLFSH